MSGFDASYLIKKLNWFQHISTKTSTHKSMNILKTHSHSEWGSDPNILIRTFQAYKSKLDYGTIVYRAAKGRIINT